MVVQHCYSLTGVWRDRGVCILLAMTASVAVDKLLALFVSRFLLYEMKMMMTMEMLTHLIGCCKDLKRFCT